MTENYQETFRAAMPHFNNSLPEEQLTPLQQAANEYVIFFSKAGWESMNTHITAIEAGEVTLDEDSLSLHDLKMNRAATKAVLEELKQAYEKALHAYMNRTPIHDGSLEDDLLIAELALRKKIGPEYMSRPLADIIAKAKEADATNEVSEYLNLKTKLTNEQKGTRMPPDPGTGFTSTK